MNNKNCSWENCQEPAANWMKWRREDPLSPSGSTYDFAWYCDGHRESAHAQGAVDVVVVVEGKQP